MLSPDGKWVWDGQQWQPIAQHESVFPSWQSISVEPASPAAAPAGPAASPFPVQAPVPTPYPVRAPAVVQPINPALLYPQAQTETPLWERGREARPGMTPNYLYFVAGLVVIVIVLVVLNSVFPLWLLLPGPKPPPAPASPRPSPLPALSQRSEYARADYFINTVLPTKLTPLQPLLTDVAQQCTRQLTNSCQAALTAVDPPLQATASLVAKSQVPLCISPAVATLKGDLKGLSDAVAVENKAFADNRPADLQAGARGFAHYQATLAADLAALGRASKTCDPRVTGP